MRIPLTLMLLASCYCANAQEFKEGLIFDVRGPVKTVSIDNDSYGLINSMSFTEDGRCTTSRMEFDADGYPVGLTINLDSGLENNDKAKATITYEIDYDCSQRIASTRMNLPVGPGAGVEEKTFAYASDTADCNELKGMSVLSTNEDGTTKTDYTYSSYSYDDRGNWISRNVVKTISTPSAPDASSTSEYVETRTLTYY